MEAVPEGSSARSAVLDLLGRSTVLLAGRDKPAAKLGSGFFIAPGIVLTCAHVVFACENKPDLVSAVGGARWRVERIVRSLEEIGADIDRNYLPFPDLALILVQPEDSGTAQPPCAWLARANPPGSGSALTLVTPQRVGKAKGPATVPLHYAWQTETQDPGTVWAATPELSVGPVVAKGMSGSPVLDEDTLRVVGVVKASADEGALAHVTPVGSGLAVFAAILGHTPTARAAESEPNAVIEAWHAHDAYHAGIAAENAAGAENAADAEDAAAAGEWPRQLAWAAADAGQAVRPAYRLEPSREAALFGLFARAEQPRIDAEAVALYRTFAQAPTGMISPGPIQCLRDAAWHLVRAGGTENEARRRLGSLARHLGDRARSAGDDELSTALHAWADDAPPSVRAEREPDSALEAHPAQDHTPVHPRPHWPAGVIVKIELSFRSGARLPLYRAEILTLDDLGNWRSSAVLPTPYPLEELCERLGEPLANAVSALSPAEPVVEFVVPRRLFDHAFDRIPLPGSVPLGEQCPVVVRDGETFDEPCDHEPAVRAWRLFEKQDGQPPVALSCAELPDAEETDANPALRELLRNRLAGHAPKGRESLRGRLAVLPGKAGPGERAGATMDALRRARVPAALWTRHPHPHGAADGSATCFGAVFTGEAAAGVRDVPLAELPHRVNELRQQARLDGLLAGLEAGEPGGVNPDNHPLASAVLLWDPPHRKPDAVPYVTPGTYAPAPSV